MHSHLVQAVQGIEFQTLKMEWLRKLDIIKISIYEQLLFRAKRIHEWIIT
jgi:hypothetical protein